METREEVMFEQLYDRRADFLRDMDIVQLMELVPSGGIMIKGNDTKEFLIEVIIENVWDKQINEEVK